jgi:hypothetical protein
MSPLVRLATAGLFMCAAIVLPSVPAYSADTLQRSAPATALLPLPDLPLPQVSVPPLPTPEVSAPEPPVVPHVPQVPHAPSVPPPVVSTPKLSSPQQPAASSPPQGEKSGARTKAQAAGSSASGRHVTGQGALAGSPQARPVIAQVDHAQGAQALNRNADDYLLGLVHDELCAVLPALLKPMPKTVVGLSPRVIAQLPPEIVNVVPEQVLATATVRCSAAEAPGAGQSAEEDGPLTRVLGIAMHPHTGMVGAAALPIGLGLLSLGIGLRVSSRAGVHNTAA